MEEIIEIGMAYYANLSYKEKKSAKEFFKSMYLNSYGELEFDEYIEFVNQEDVSPEKIANYKCFEALDVDGNGSLNADEVIPLYYLKNSLRVLTCEVCGVVLKGEYFSCFQCFTNESVPSYNVCCGCYGDKKHRHHDDAVFYDIQLMAYKVKSQGKASSSSRGRPQEDDEVDELQLTAEAYYENVSGDIKDEADEFFDEMDKNENEGISFLEYASYMKREGYDQRVIDRKFFKYLNQSGSGELDRMEVMTLYYVIESGRPFCDGCNEFIKGMFFTCLDCYNHKERHRPTFNVCPKCFKEGHYEHPKGYFVDNFVLLRIEGNRLGDLKKKLRTESAKESGNYNNSYYNQASRSYSASNVMVPYQNMEETGGNDSNRYGGGSNRFSTSNDIVPYIPQPRKDKEKWLSIVSSVAGMGASAAAVIGGCTVM